MKTGKDHVNHNRLTSEDYVFYALGTLDGPERALLYSHLRADCEICLSEVRQALEFWFIFAALTDRTQTVGFAEPSLQLRDRVISIGRLEGNKQVVPIRSSPIRPWMRTAAGILLAVSAAGLSWRIGRLQSQKDISVAQIKSSQQEAAFKQLESQNNALQNLVVAARNAPAVFPGRESIVSVQDPYVLRDLQKARQTQVAISHALADERARAAGLEKQLSQTSTLLASVMHEKEVADRRYRKAFDAALEKEHGVSQFATEIAAYKDKVHDLESEVAHYRAVVDVQKSGMEQHLQMISLLQSQGVSLVQLRGTEAGARATGVVLIADGRLAFFPADLPAAPAGRTYQLWLIRDTGPATVSAGTFDVGPKDSAALQFGNRALIAGVKAIAVTDEPAGGSALPTGHKLLMGIPKR